MDEVRICNYKNCGNPLKTLQYKYCSNACRNLGHIGYIPTQEIRDKVSRKLKGRRIGGEDPIGKGLKIKEAKKNKDNSCSEETKKKLRIALKGKNKGKHPSEETREKLRLAKLGKPRSKESIRKGAAKMKGHVVSITTRDKIRKKALERIANKDYRSFTSITPSKMEVAWGVIVEQSFNISLERSFWLGGRCFDYKFKNYLFELDGSYWHRTEEHKKRDLLKNEIAKNNGYDLIRFPIETAKDALVSIHKNWELLGIIFKTDIFNINTGNKMPVEASKIA